MHIKHNGNQKLLRIHIFSNPFEILPHSKIPNKLFNQPDDNVVAFGSFVIIAT